MDRRQFAIGVAASLLGVALLGVLAADGAIGGPAAAIERANPVELVPIGGGFLLLTAGLVAAFAAYAADAIDD